MAVLLSGGQTTGNGRAQVIVPAEAADLTYDPDTHTVRSADSGMITVTTGRSH